MVKNFSPNAEITSAFLSPPPPKADKRSIDVGTRTLPLRSARIININKINSDPDQPRKTFNQESLESLAESISELDGIIDPITVEYIEKDDCYRIISGERRYRASKMVGLVELPCIIKEVDDHNRFLMQFIANLQREDIQPLEEAAGIKHLMEINCYTQTKMAKLLNKSKSYISQILGLERLSEPARKIIERASIPKEAQIQASREPDPSKQSDILMIASADGKTIRQLRNEQVGSRTNEQQKRLRKARAANTNKIIAEFFREWRWESPDHTFSIIIKFKENHATVDQPAVCRKVLRRALVEVKNAPSPLPSPRPL